MTALSAERGLVEETWADKVLPLAAVKVYQGGQACLDSATGYVTNAASGSTTLVPIGTFMETVDNSGGSAGDLSVNVQLAREITVRRWVNDTGGGAIANTDRGKTCYLKDDQTVTISSSGNSAAGRVWDVDATDGVAVQNLNA